MHHKFQNAALDLFPAVTRNGISIHINRFFRKRGHVSDKLHMTTLLLGTRPRGRPLIAPKNFCSHDILYGFINNKVIGYRILLSVRFPDIR